MLVVRARVLAIDRATEDAAADLGAGRFRVFWTVTFPQLQTAVLAAAVLAFTFSFDDLIISVFPGDTNRHDVACLFLRQRAVRPHARCVRRGGSHVRVHTSHARSGGTRISGGKRGDSGRAVG